MKHLIKYGLKMMKHLIKCGLMNIACIMDVLALLFIVNHWFSIKPSVLKMIVFSMFILGLIATGIQFTRSSDFEVYTTFINWVDRLSFIVCVLCIASANLKIAYLNIKPGSSLYDKYSLPAMLPLVAGFLLFIIKKK